MPATLVASGGAAQRKVAKVSQSSCCERGSLCVSYKVTLVPVRDMCLSFHLYSRLCRGMYFFLSVRYVYSAPLLSPGNVSRECSRS